MSTRNEPCPRAVSARAVTAARSATSHATPTVPSLVGARRSAAMTTSAIDRTRSMQALPIPLPAPVITAVAKRVSLKRQQASDPVVVPAQERRQHARDGSHVERARLAHRLQVGPVLGAVEECLEHRKVVTREERQLG